MHSTKNIAFTVAILILIAVTHQSSINLNNYKSLFQGWDLNPLTKIGNNKITNFPTNTAIGSKKVSEIGLGSTKENYYLVNKPSGQNYANCDGTYSLTSNVLINRNPVFYNK
jgi:hypothetical protein